MLNSLFRNKSLSYYVKLSYHIILFMNFYILHIQLYKIYINYYIKGKLSSFELNRTERGVLIFVLVWLKSSFNLNEIEPNIEQFRAQSTCYHPYVWVRNWHFEALFGVGMINSYSGTKVVDVTLMTPKGLVESS